MSGKEDNSESKGKGPRYCIVPVDYRDDLQDALGYLEEMAAQDAEKTVACFTFDAHKVSREDVDDLVKAWRERGVYIETEWDEDSTRRKIKVTNSSTTLPEYSAKAFKVWEKTKGDIQQSAWKKVEQRFGSHPNLSKMRKMRFPLGVWFFNDSEAFYPSESMQQALLDHTDKIERLVDVCSEFGRHEDILELWLPSTFRALEGRLSEEYLTVLHTHLKQAHRYDRESMLALMLPALIMNTPKDTVSPSLIATTIQQANKLRATLPKKMKESWDVPGYMVFDEHSDSMMRDAIPEALVPIFESSRGEYTPETLSTVSDFTELIASNVNGVLEDVVPAIMRRSPEILSQGDLRSCLLMIDQLVRVYAPENHSQLTYNILPTLIEKISRVGSVVDIVKYVTERLTAVIQTCEHSHTIIDTLLGIWVRKDQSHAITENGFERTLLALTRIDNACRGNGKKVLTLLAYGLVNSRTPVETEEYEEYATVLERSVPTTNVPHMQALDERASSFVITHSTKNLTPKLFEKYLTRLSGIHNESLKTACELFVSVENDMDELAFDTFVLLAEKINAFDAKINSTLPSYCIKDIVGAVGSGDDEKPTSEALLIASAYVAYLEKNLGALKRAFGGVKRKDNGEAWNWYYEQSNTFVKRYLKSGNPINKRTARLQKST